MTRATLVFSPEGALYQSPGRRPGKIGRRDIKP
jgi:hypothetical protein